MQNKKYATVPPEEKTILNWKGKKPIEKITPCPVQLIEKISSAGIDSSLSYDNLEKNWHNLLFHGDNKEVLCTLLANGFDGKVDLIYLDPPFDSKADYIKKIALKGQNKKNVGHSFGRQVQYTDIWEHGEYLQFMYERLTLLQKLLSEQGSLYLHCDWHASHHLRAILDQVFGENNFINEIVWSYKSGGVGKKGFAKKHDLIYFYAKNNEKFIFNAQKERSYNRGGKAYRFEGVKEYQDENGLWYTLVNMRSVWEIDMLGRTSHDRTDYPTQKPEALLERIITASTDKNSIVLDCFSGSGTTQAMAEKLGRRWIGVDNNKGAIQTTLKRILKIHKNPKQKKPPRNHTTGVLHYQLHKDENNDGNRAHCPTQNMARNSTITHHPISAKVIINKENKKVTIDIQEYISPAILTQLKLQANIFTEKAFDFRSQIDMVFIDTNYDGKIFNIYFFDIPKKQNELIQGKYEYLIESDNNIVGIKIIDILGDETIISG